MAEEEDGFLDRWSSLKRAANAAETETKPQPPDQPRAAEPAEAFDIASLPAIESLDAGSDYTAFLKEGVPKALRLAALRRAWATDPAITGYKTLADYDWNFNAPGYGRLLPADDPKKMVDALFRHLRTSEPAPAEPATAIASAEAADNPPGDEGKQPGAARREQDPQDS